MNKYIGWLAMGLFMVAPVIYANNIEIDSCWIVEKNTAQHYYTVGLEISWENSWRDSTNSDAGWVFMKYQKESAGNTWFHATLDTLDGSHQIWSSTPMMADASFEKDNWGTGIMIYRTDSAESDISCDSVYLRWYYNRGQTMTDADSCTGLQVFGIEIVYIPEGKFFVGDTLIKAPLVYDSTYSFYRYNKIENSPYQIASESPIQMGTTEGYLWAGDGYLVSTGILPADYPKGHNSFYIMRYEVSQCQYRDFLNTIDFATAVSLYPDHYGENRYYIRMLGEVIGCDANGNACLDESNDGQWIACNYLSSDMQKAYLDFAGLRPFTELEYEKACRGPIWPVPGEYAWGTTDKVEGSIEFACTDSERITPANANHCGTIPYRCGGCADPGDNRVESSASYYGVMDLTGNLWGEPVISVEETSFIGNHGDGILSTSPGWPALGVRSLHCYYNCSLTTVSSRCCGRRLKGKVQGCRGGRSP